MVQKVREFFCNHDYELDVSYSEVEVVRLPVHGKRIKKIVVICKKCHKQIINYIPPTLLRKIDFEKTKNHKGLDIRNIPDPMLINSRHCIYTGVNDQFIDRAPSPKIRPLGNGLHEHIEEEDVDYYGDDD